MNWSKLNRFLVLLSLLLFAFTLINYYQIISSSSSSHSDCADSKTKTTLNSNLHLKFSSNPIYVITPTYVRPVQKAELTRLSHTLLLVANVHWIVVEDSRDKTELVEKLLQRTFRQQTLNFNYTHLNVATPKEFQTKVTDPNWLKPRGVWQRNLALKWLREHSHLINPEGVVYFADDDNTYDLRLFDEIRTTFKVSVFPVGLVGGLLVERPLVDQNGKVVAFNSVWNVKRTFPIDMAAFSIKLRLLLEKPNVYFSDNVARGYQETHLLSQLIDSIEELEPKGDMCRKVLVWHTRTEQPKLKQEHKLRVPSNLGMLDD